MTDCALTDCTAPPADGCDMQAVRSGRCLLCASLFPAVMHPGHLAQALDCNKYITRLDLSDNNIGEALLPPFLAVLEAGTVLKELKMDKHLLKTSTVEYMDELLARNQPHRKTGPPWPTRGV